MASDDVGLSPVPFYENPEYKRHPINTKTDQLPISEVITGLPRPYHNRMLLKWLGTSCLTPGTANHFFFFFSRHFFAPGKGAKYGHFWADWFLCGRSAAWFNIVLQYIYVFLIQKTATKSKKTSKIKSDTGKGSYKHNHSFITSYRKDVSFGRA